MKWFLHAAPIQRLVPKQENKMLTGRNAVKQTPLIYITCVILCVIYPSVIAHSSHNGLRTTHAPYIAYHPHPPISTGDVPNVRIHCTEMSVTGVWTRAPFVGNILQVSLLDCECNKFQTNATHFWITARFDGCGSVIEARTDSIVQRNSATVKVINVTNNVISREHVYQYNMECIFARDKNVSISEHYNVTDSITRIYNKTSLGLFETSIGVYDSESFVRTALLPVTVTSNQPIYIGIKKLTENQNLKMVVQQCFATPTSNIHDDTSYIFFHNKCPLDATFKIIRYNDHEFNFVINTFKFIKISQVVYIHCRIYICKTNSTLPICDQTCSYRKRRDVNSNTVIKEHHDVKNIRHRHIEITSHRTRRTVSNEYYVSDSPELEEVRYITSTRIFYVKRNECDVVTCPQHSTCVDLYPAVCICEPGYVLSFKTNLCEGERVLEVEGLHLNKTWLDSYSDVNSEEFRLMAYKTETELRRLFHELYLPDVEGVKITRATRGSVIVDFDMIVSATSDKITTYNSLVRAIVIGNKSKTSTYKELAIIPETLPTIKLLEKKKRSMKDMITTLLEISVPALFIALFAVLLFIHKQCRTNRQVNNNDNQSVTAVYEAKNPEPQIVKFDENRCFPEKRNEKKNVDRGFPEKKDENKDGDRPFPESKKEKRRGNGGFPDKKNEKRNGDKGFPEKKNEKRKNGDKYLPESKNQSRNSGRRLPESQSSGRRLPGVNNGCYVVEGYRHSKKEIPPVEHVRGGNRSKANSSWDEGCLEFTI